jgi:hypothetical protein
VVPYANHVDLSTWTAVNQVESAHQYLTWTDYGGVYGLNFEGGVTGHDVLRGFASPTLPTPPYTFTVVLRGPAFWGNNSNEFCGYMIGHYEAGSTKVVTYGIQSGNPVNLVVNFWVSPSNSGGGSQTNHLCYPSGPHWLRIHHDGVNFNYYISTNGRNFGFLFAQSATSGFTTGATALFIGGYLFTGSGGSGFPVDILSVSITTP